jgi:hypothetical protein
VCTEAHIRLDIGDQPFGYVMLVTPAPNRRDNVLLGGRYAEFEGYHHGFPSGKRFSHW